MSQTIQLRRDTTTNWTSVNPILAVGEMGVVLDDLSYKIGNGVTPWNSLPQRQLQGLFAAAMLMEAVGNPSVPAAGQMKFYAHSVAGRIMPKWIGPSGLDSVVQSAMYGNGMVMLSPGTGTAMSTLGTGAPTATGTVSHPAIATGLSLRQAMRRAIVTGSATAGNQAGLRVPAFLTYRGEDFGGVPMGGFFNVTRFAVSSTVSGQRGFVGLYSGTTAISGTQVTSALLNCVGAGWDSGDANLHIVHNDGAGTATKIDLGANFPATAPNAVFELALFSAPNSETIGYRVNRLDVPSSVSGIITSSDIPASSTLLTWHAAFNNGSTAASVVTEIMRMYLETDY